MVTNNQGNAPSPGWYMHPHTGQPAWWTGAGWTVAPPTPPAPPQAPPQAQAPISVAAAPMSAAPAAATGGAMNQFGFPAGPSAYPAPTRYSGSTPSPVRSSGGGGRNLGTWLVVGVLAIALVGGVLLVFRGLGKTAQAGAQTVQQAIGQAKDTDVRQALLNASAAMETWFTDHQNFAIKGPVVGISTTAHVQYWATTDGYCLRAYSSTGTAQGPANRTYFWYDSQGGGIQPLPGPTPPKATPGGACAAATSFTALN